MIVIYDLSMIMIFYFILNVNDIVKIYIKDLNYHYQ